MRIGLITNIITPKRNPLRGVAVVMMHYNLFIHMNMMSNNFLKVKKEPWVAFATPRLRLNQPFLIVEIAP